MILLILEKQQKQVIMKIIFFQILIKQQKHIILLLLAKQNFLILIIAQEEIKSQVELLGKMRAKYKEDVNNKYEIRDVVNMYSKMHDFASPILQKYKLRASKSMSDLKENKKITGKNIFKEKPNIKNKEANIGIRQIIRNKNVNIETEDKTNSKKKEPKTPNEFEQLSISKTTSRNNNKFNEYRYSFPSK